MKIKDGIRGKKKNKKCVGEDEGGDDGRAGAQTDEMSVR